MTKEEINELIKIADKIRDYVPSSYSDYEYIKFLLEYLLKALKKSKKQMEKQKKEMEKNGRTVKNCVR